MRSRRSTARSQPLRRYTSSTPGTALRLPTARLVEAYTINAGAEIFEGLKADYAEFDGWWRRKVVGEQRDVVIIGDEDAPEGLAVLKAEVDRPYGLSPSVLKLCTFKVAGAHRGDKRGELLLKAAVMHARDHALHDIYVEVLPDKVDLLEWLGRFGFTALPDAGRQADS